MESGEQETWYAKCNEAEEWLEDEGSNQGFKTYQTRTYDMNLVYNKYFKRGKESKTRGEMIEKMTSILVEMKGRLPEILEAKPWINEGEASDVTSKIDDTLKWLDKKIVEQEKAGLTTDPVLTSSDMLSKTEQTTKLFKKITEKKKPREKKKKKEEKTKEEEETADKQNEEENSSEDHSN